MLKTQSVSVTGRDVERPPSPSEYADGPAVPRRFDQFDFREMFAGVRPVAIVGNAATVLEFDDGELIDSQDNGGSLQPGADPPASRTRSAAAPISSSPMR
jgi:hypothetical protein